MSFDWKINFETVFMVAGLLYTFGGFGTSVRNQLRQMEKLSRSLERLTTAVNELRVRDKLPPINHD